MKINVGSKNPTKIAAVEEAVRLYPKLFPEPEVSGLDVAIDLYGHPQNLEETIKGARDRAGQAFQNCAYSFGLEGGLIEVPYTKTGFMEIGVCAIYDGQGFALGLTPAFEWPKQVTRMILAGEADASQALKQLGLTDHEKLGTTKSGAAGFLTDDRATRQNIIKDSIIMAMIQLEHPELYA